MELFLDCLPCLLRQTLEAGYMATENEKVHEAIMDEALAKLSQYKKYKTAPELCEAMHFIVKKHTKVEDPYFKIKENDINESLKLGPFITKYGASGDDMLLKALKISATGNVMDSAIYLDLNIKSILKDELEKPFAISSINSFKNDLKSSTTILIIGDNAGEVVFDKVLAKYLKKNHKVIYAVRDKPIINDATIDDAMKTGIQEYAKIISTGSKMPGAVISSCSIEFKKIFESADIVISKGQGNFEALSNEKRDIYFLLKAKCHKIANRLNVDINEYVFKKITFS